MEHGKVVIVTKAVGKGMGLVGERAEDARGTRHEQFGVMPEVFNAFAPRVQLVGVPVDKGFLVSGPALSEDSLEPASNGAEIVVLELQNTQAPIGGTKRSQHRGNALPLLIALGHTSAGDQLRAERGKGLAGKRIVGVFHQIIECIHEHLGIPRRREGSGSVAEGDVFPAAEFAGNRAVQKSKKGAESFEALAGFMDGFITRDAMAAGEVRENMRNLRAGDAIHALGDGFGNFEFKAHGRCSDARDRTSLYLDPL